MARFKQLLSHVRVVTAGRVRKCYHSEDHPIAKGDMVVEVKGRQNWSGYCRSCGDEMLSATDSRLRELREGLASGIDTPPKKK